MTVSAVPVVPIRRKALVGRMLFLLLSLVFVLFVYTFLHEGGHALVGLLFGGKLTAFSVNFWEFTAHAAVFGDFNNTQRALISVAGISLPLLVWLGLLLLVPRCPNSALDWLRAFATMGTLNTLLAWIVIPLLYLSGSAPGDDATNFLNFTGLPPVLVTAAALVLYAAGWTLFFQRSGSPREIITRLRQPELDFSAPAARRSLAGMAAVALVSLITVLMLDAHFARQQAAGVQPDLPAGYALVTVLDLDADGSPVAYQYDFTLAQPTEIGFFIVLQDIRRGPAAIILHGPQDYQSVFLTTGEDFKTGRSTVFPHDIPLEPGDYSLQISLPPNPGSVSIYQSGLDE
jgi:hypothetical protein